MGGGVRVRVCVRSNWDSRETVEMYFFFSSRRRHTRLQGDWSSDVCSSDLAVEPTPSVTGATADHRLPLRASEVELFARALAAKLGLGGSVTLPGGAEKWLDTVAKDLQKHKGVSLVAAGEQQPAEVHALAHALNAALGNVGATDRKSTRLNSRHPVISYAVF